MKNAFADSSLPTLAEIDLRVRACSDLSLQRKAAIASAIKTACRWFELPPSAVLAHPEFLRRRFKGFAPAAHDVKAKRVANVRSELLFALRRFDLAGKGTYLSPMAPKWLALWNELPSQYARTAFSRLFRFCSAGRIEPDDVDDEVATDFLAALVGETLVKNPKVTHQNMCRLWNRMHGQVNGWPTAVLVVPRYAEHYILPWSEFPDSFKADVDGYLANLGHDDILNLDAPPQRLKPRTIAAYRYELRRFASMLVHRGHAADSISSVAYLVEPKHVEDGLRFLLARRDNKPNQSAFDIAILLRNVAKHWVKSPPETLEIIKRYAKNVRPANGGLGIKNRQRLAPLRDEKNLARLFLLPAKIRKEIQGKGGESHKHALLLQHAVALMILNYAPIRVGNLATLHIERNLRWSAPNMKGGLVIDIDGSQVKNSQALTFPLPVECADLIRLYLRSYHARLAVGPNPYLFPSDLPGRPKRSDTLAKQLSRLIHRTIGLEVNPHLYRHLVHLVVLNRYPGSYALISRILGHRSLQTAISNYAGEDIGIAMRAFQGLVGDVIAGRTKHASISEVASGLNTSPRLRGQGR